MDFYGQGSDFLWIDPFVDLQRKLPEEVFLNRKTLPAPGIE